MITLFPLQLHWRLVPLLGLLAFTSVPAHAADLYGGVAGSYTSVKLSKTHFNLAQVQGHVGRWLWEGIGLELRGNVGLNDDTERGLTTEVPQIFSVAARFQSPREAELKAYILLGASRVELKSDSAGSNFPGSDNFNGGLLTVGLLAPISDNHRLSFLAEFSRYFIDNENDVLLYNGSLGIQYEF